MKKRIIHLSSVLLVLTLMFSLCACSSSFETKKEELGVSFDDIICQYSFGRTDLSYGTHITFYADNTVRVWSTLETKASEKRGTKAITEVYTEITEEQKNELLQAIEANNLLGLADCSDFDAGYNDHSDNWAYIIFYDAEGNDVHFCGGINPNEKHYNNVVRIILDYFPYTCDIRTQVRETSEECVDGIQFCNYIGGEIGDDAVSSSKYVFSLCLNYVSTSYSDDTYPVYAEEMISVLPNGDLELKITACADAYEYLNPDEYLFTEPRVVTEIIEIESYQTVKLFDFIYENLDRGVFAEADTDFMDIPEYTFLCWSGGRMYFYNEDGEHIYTHYTTQYDRYDNIEEELYDMGVQLPRHELLDELRVLITEDAIALLASQQ